MSTTERAAKAPAATKAKTKPARQGTQTRKTTRRFPEVCVCIPTYNEAANIRPFVRSVISEFNRLEIRGVIVIVDDGSPDGTGALADSLAANEPRIHVIHREGKAGIGSAYRAAFAWALARKSEHIVQMDCDFSHDPAMLGPMLEAAQEADLVVGSRYVKGGGTEHWPLVRKLVSRLGSWYARTILGVPVRDLTGGFKCFRRQTLEHLVQEDLSASGYGFQVETTYRVFRAGLRVKEIPIIFRDRTVGESKMSVAIAREAALLVLQLRVGRRPGERMGAAVRRSAARGRDWLTGPAWRRVTGRAVLRAVATLLVTAAAVGLLLVEPLSSIGYELIALGFLALTFIAVTTLCWMLYAWRDGDSMSETRFPRLSSPPQYTFSLIVPARHEEEVLAQTLARLAEQTHPMFEVIVVVGHDDPGTRDVAARVAAVDPRFRIVTDRSAQKNKPRALNTALPFCNGDVVGVFDAEDHVAPDLLLAVDNRFVATDAEIVQGGVQLMNVHSSWFATRNVLEYYFWFRSRLHFHAAQRFIPLGGNTIFVRRAWLEHVDGWDADCLAEDCDLGARLSAIGARTIVCYSPELATREETPETIGALLRQRTRWNQGFLQVLKKGDWKTLPPKARLLAAYTLSFPFIQALTGVLLPIAIAVSLLVKLPILLALVSFVPLIPLTMIVAAEIVALSDFGREFGIRIRARDVALLVIGAVPYQLILSLAAMRAVWRESRGVTNWEKTEHVGAHR